MLRRCESITGYLSIINWVDDVNWPPQRVLKWRSKLLTVAGFHYQLSWWNQIVTLVTIDETSRGVAKACLLSVADVGTILQVVVKPRKPRWRSTVFIEITKTKTKTITKTITIVNWNYNNIITNAWIYLNWCERHERNALRTYVDKAIKITTINVN